MAQDPQIGDPSASHQTPIPPAQPPPTVAGSLQAGTSQVFPAMMPGITSSEKPESNDGAGIYAVAYYPFMGMESMTMSSPCTLIPLKYSIPPARQASAGGAGREQGQEIRQQHGPQGQVVVRRFHFHFQLDLILILKLAVMVFLLSQDGSEQKLIILILFAALVYLYQTGVLTPFIQWLQRVGAPAQRQPLVQPQNNQPVAQIERNNVQPDNTPEAENQNVPENNDAAQAANENQIEHGRQGANWWGIVKEIQTFVVGFITSLLPGVHND